MGKRDQTQLLDTLLDSITADLLPEGQTLEQDRGLWVERILLELIRPDPVQPRRVLPESLHGPFHQNRLTPTGALRGLVQSAQIAARQHGRPFSNVLELLPHADEEGEASADVKWTPEEQLVRDLVTLAVTIRDDGQVNPLTVVDVSQGATHGFRIETGERRYWATWLLRDFIPDYIGDGTIPCIIIPHERASVFRQARENTARTGLSAIAMARQAALLLLTVHGYEIPAYAVDNDFYRQALKLDLRGKREYTDAILAAMGGIDKGRLNHFKMLLKLSDEAMELADRHNIDERKLRSVLPLASEYHGEVVRQIIDFNLTSNQIEELISGETLTHENAEDDIPPAALKFARLATNNKTSARDIAYALLRQEGDSTLARARLQYLTRLLNEAEAYLTDG